MWLLAWSFAGTILLMGLSSFILGWRHSGSRLQADRRDTAAYYAERRRRDRFLREEHMGFALLSGILIGGLNAWWLQDTLIPAICAALVFGLLWPLWTYLLWKPKNQMMIYDNQDLSNLGRSLQGYVMIGIIVSIACGGGFVPWMVSLVVSVVVWLALFPL